MLQNLYRFQEFLKNKLFDNSKKKLGFIHKISNFPVQAVRTFFKYPSRCREEDLQQKQPSTGQKQAFPDVLQNKCSQNFRNIHRKTPVLAASF